ncbi:MAG: cbb3-type cytochrome c oxidase N-terminal domain-containing protein, partial [Chitinophagaceae bacterium]
MSIPNRMSIWFRRKTQQIMALGILLLFVPINSVWAAGPPLKSSLTNPLVVSFVLLMLLLLLIIALLANVLLGTLKFYREKEKSEEKVLPLIIGFLVISLQSQAQAVTTTYGGLSTTTFMLILSVLLIEVVVILFMLLQLKAVLAKEKAQHAIAAPVRVTKKETISWWDRLNRFRPAEQEVDIDLGHDYDCIRELDNRLPPWWLWGFYLTILTAGIYLWRFHIVHTAPLSAEEFELSMKAAEARQAEYLKKTANLIDENSIQLVTTDVELNAGKS